MSEYQNKTIDQYRTAESVRPVRQAMPLRCAHMTPAEVLRENTVLRCEAPVKFGNAYMSFDGQDDLVGGERWYAYEADRIFKQTDRYSKSKAELVCNFLRGFFVDTETKNFQYGIAEELREIDDLDVRDEFDRQVEAARNATLSPKELYKLGTCLSSIDSIELARLTTPDGGEGLPIEAFLGDDFEGLSYKKSRQKIYPLTQFQHQQDVDALCVEVSSWIFEIRDTFGVDDQDMDITHRRMYCVPQGMIIDGKIKSDVNKNWKKFVKANKMKQALREINTYGLFDELHYCLAQVVYAHEPRQDD